MASNQRTERLYVLLDSGNTPLAQGVMETPFGLETMQLRILDDKTEAVAAHEIVQMFSVNGNDPPLQCQLLRRRDERIVLKRLATLDPAVRRNLRVPVKFNSFIYPLTGRWKGRRDIESIDLSCGGIAFYAGAGLGADEKMEIVIPITEEPLILRCQILKRQTLRDGRMMYATKFINMCEDEEVAVRKAVFSTQLRNEPRRSDAQTDTGNTQEEAK